MDSQIQITHIPLGQIHPSPMNPRKHFDEASIKELADSIAEKGVLQPILVRKNETGYEIVAGERRYRASCTVRNLSTDIDRTIPAIIRDLTDDEALEIMITENLQRKDIHPMEEAAGFLQLTRIKHFDVKEIAARVGKSPAYVAQRLKLNSLIEPIQQFFFDGHLLMKDALILAPMPSSDQQEFYDERLADETGVYEITNWTIQKYQHNLMNAPFDTTDADIIKSVGPCTTCQFNTASDSVLFQDQADKASCMNHSCFKQKCDLAYTIRLDEAKTDPAIVLITGEYNPDQETKALMKKVEGILEYEQYYKIHIRDRFPERESFEGDNDTEEEDEQDFQEAVKEYHDARAEFEKKVATGGYIKAFIVGGDHKGEFTYVKLNKKAKTTAQQAAKASSTGESQAEIKIEIDRLRTREKRSKELDDAKVWSELYPHLDAAKISKEIIGELSPIERVTLAHAIYYKISSTEKFRKALGIKTSEGRLLIDAVPPALLNRMLRFFFADVLPSPQIFGSIKGHAAIMRDVAQSYWPKIVSGIYAVQAEAAAKRSTRVDQRIKSLQAKLKEVTKSKATATPTKVKTKRVAGKKPTPRNKVK